MRTETRLGPPAHCLPLRAQDVPLPLAAWQRPHSNKRELLYRPSLF